jgi:hypothetical protein
MFASVLLALALAAAPVPPQAAACPAGLEAACAAVEAALSVPGARAEVQGMRVASGRGCPAQAVETLRPVTASGEAPLRLYGTLPDGARCEAYAWARVRVLAPALALSRAVAAGDALGAALAPEPVQVEVRTGQPAPLAALPDGGRAARALPAGAALLAADVRTGPLPGEPITVVVRAGSVELAAAARAVGCARGKACAVLPSGRRVEGRLEAGRLVLETP